MNHAFQEVRLTGLSDAMAPACLPVFFRGKITARFQICGEVQFAKLQFAFYSWAQRFKEGGRYVIWAEGPLSSDLPISMIKFR